MMHSLNRHEVIEKKKEKFSDGVDARREEYAWSLKGSDDGAL
jgi:hypothetical protein